jgi:C-terminal processing protease CtpA/Prc
MNRQAHPLYMDISKDIKEEQKRDDTLYFVEDGEAGFDPKWNKLVIERSIKKYEAMRKRKQKDYVESIRERSDAVATYLKSRAAESNRPVESYFSKRELAYLRGEKIVRKLKQNSLLGKKGRDLYLPG